MGIGEGVCHLASLGILSFGVGDLIRRASLYRRIRHPFQFWFLNGTFQMVSARVLKMMGVRLC